MLVISENLAIPLSEIDMAAIRAQGTGGQNVNKVATAIHLRFDIGASRSLPDESRARLLQHRDQRISSDGIIVIKAQRYRSQDKNRADALARLQTLIRSILTTQSPRKKTRPSHQQRAKRLQQKNRRSKLKQLRSNKME